MTEDEIKNANLVQLQERLGVLNRELQDIHKVLRDRQRSCLHLRLPKRVFPRDSGTVDICPDCSYVQICPYYE